MSLFRYMAAEKNIVEVDLNKMPHAYAGCIIADIEQKGKTITAVLTACHPFDGDDFRCVKTGTTYRGLESKNWRTIKKG